jgi:DNA-binding SARP family transcriptional activator/tetratricopeptide (TPR) repeat protein
VYFRVLGPVEVVHNGQVLPVNGGLRCGLLGVLLLSPGKPVSTGALIDALWAEHAPATARTQLQAMIGTLRRVLGPGLLITRSPGYLIDVPPSGTDLGQFRELVSAGKPRAALALWRGAPLANASVPGLAAVLAGLAEEKIPALVDSLTEDLAAGRPGLIAELTALVAEYPWREQFRVLLMKALHASGRTAEALTVYRETHEQFVTELGLEPGHELAATHHAILTGTVLAGTTGPSIRTTGPSIRTTGFRGAREQERGGERAWAGGAREEKWDAGLARQGGAGEKARHSEKAREEEWAAGRAWEAVARADEARHSEKAREAAARAEGAPNQLPATIADFAGREAELERARAALTCSGDAPEALPVLVISGPGGIGKSTLALRLAHELRAHWPDGQLFAQLGGLGSAADPGRSLDRFLRALGVHGSAIPDSLAERQELFRMRCAAKRVLILLDDAPDEQTVRALLPGSAGCAVLVTSRRRLATLPGAQRIDLDLLPGSTALRMFGAAAAQDPAGCAELIQLCGGLPLALRITSARLAARPQWTATRLAKLIASERDRLGQFAYGDLAVRASLSLSYQALSSGEQLGLRQLSLLDIPMIPESVAAAVLEAGPSEADRVLGTLTDAHLLQPQRVYLDEPGYTMHDLVRLFAREEAQAVDPQRERATVLRRAGRALTDGAASAGHALTGVKMLSVHSSGTQRNSFEGDPVAWFEAARPAAVALLDQLAAAGEAELTWDLAGSFGNFFRLRGRHDEWEHTHQLALTASAEAGLPLGRAVALRGLGELWQTRDAFAQSVQSYQDAAGAFLALKETVLAAESLAGAADALRELGRYDESGKACLDALRLGAQEPRVAARAELCLGSLAYNQGRKDEAEAHYTKSIASAVSAADGWTECAALNGLAVLYAAAGRAEEATGHSAKAVTLARLTGDAVIALVTELGAGWIALTVGRLPQADSFASNALAGFERLGIRYGQGLAGFLLGRIRLSQDAPAEALWHLTSAAAIFRAVSSPRYLAQTLAESAAAYAALGDTPAEQAALAEAADLYARLGLHGAKKIASRAAAISSPSSDSAE